ncbi:hypothetical protein GQ457_09G028290 [Hibiscus cannabinus]
MQKRWISSWILVNFPYSRIRAGNISCICFLFQQYNLPVAAGQERFGTLTSSYYRGAHGIILVYDGTRRETFTNLSEIWAKEVELYCTNPECIKILVGNKVDRDGERAVTREEGMALAQQRKCSFLECSAKTRANVHQCLNDLSLKGRQQSRNRFCSRNQYTKHQKTMAAALNENPTAVNTYNVETCLSLSYVITDRSCDKGQRINVYGGKVSSSRVKENHAPHGLSVQLPMSSAVNFPYSRIRAGNISCICFLFQQYNLPVAAGQERFGTLTSSYYRGAHGIILVYDGTRRETFTNLSEIWAKEVELYCTNPECIKILVGNKVDRDGERAVTREEGMALAQQRKCSFLECSAKTRANVHQCLNDLSLKGRQQSRNRFCSRNQYTKHQKTMAAALNENPTAVNTYNVETCLSLSYVITDRSCDKGQRINVYGGKVSSSRVKENHAPHGLSVQLPMSSAVNFPYSRIRAGNISCICFLFQQYNLPVAAGQERFGTLTSSYYRGAHGIILVYDGTRRETFTNLSEIWAKEVELYCTNPECIKILVGNKVDRVSPIKLPVSFIPVHIWSDINFNAYDEQGNARLFFSAPKIA